MFRAPQFRQHGRRAEPQRFFQRPQRRLPVRGADQDQPVRVDAVGGEPRAVGRAGFGRGRVFHDPHERRRAGAAPGGGESEAGRRRGVPRVLRHDLVQRAAPEPAPQGGIERQGAVAERNGGRSGGAGPARWAAPARLDAGDDAPQGGDVGGWMVLRHRSTS